MALKKPLSFSELVQENRNEILQDESWLERIEQKMQTKQPILINDKQTE